MIYQRQRQSRPLCYLLFQLQRRRTGSTGATSRGKFGKLDRMVEEGRERRDHGYVVLARKYRADSPRRDQQHNRPQVCSPCKALIRIFTCTREKISARLAREPGLQLLFLESFCNDPAVIAANIALKVQSGDPDYQGMSREEAERDFRKRIEAYEAVYDTVTEPGISFCRILNVGEQVTMNRIQGYLQSRIAFYLMNLHLKPRHIYLSRVSLATLWADATVLMSVARRKSVQCFRADWRRLRSVAARMGVCKGVAQSDSREHREYAPGSELNIRPLGVF